MQLRLACLLERSSLCCALCPYHLILLEQSTTSIFWSPRFERRESELTSFALTLQIQQIIAQSLRRRQLSVATVIAHVSATCRITLLMLNTLDLWSKVAGCGFFTDLFCCDLSSCFICLICIVLCYTTHQCFWLMLVGWLPCWERANHPAYLL